MRTKLALKANRKVAAKAFSLLFSLRFDGADETSSEESDVAVKLLLVEQAAKGNLDR